MRDLIVNFTRRIVTSKAAKVATISLAMSITGCKESPPAEILPDNAFDVSFLEDGKLITETQCLVCHSLDRSEDSPRADAPPLSTVLANYNPDMLADDFREHVHVGHPDMPDFNFNVKQTEGLLAYLSSIQDNKSSQP